MISKMIMFLVWFGVWLFLTWPPDLRQIGTAIMVSLLVSFLTNDILDERTDKKRNRSPADIVIRLGWFFWYVAVFLWECIKANIDVAYRVLHPDLPIRPGTVKIKTGLKTDIGLTFLANSLTLTPGRTTVDVDKNNGFIYVHKLYIKEGSESDKDIVAKQFEKILKKIFE